MGKLYEDLKRFLLKAKINSYASGREAKILEDFSKEFVYEENNFIYIDRYFGFNPFIGGEVVWYQGKPVWAMNYYGRVISRTISERDIYEFLRKALRRIDQDKPFRGTNFTESDFTYLNKCYGDIKLFHGVEKILYKGEEIYCLWYHGVVIA